MWGHYIWRTQWQDAFYLALDCVEDNRLVMLQKLISWCNGTPNFDVLCERVENWEGIGKCDRDRSEEVPEHMKKPLEFAYEWYKHYTVFWGAHIRTSNNKLGEGD
jgi:hypothetical protein